MGGHIALKQGVTIGGSAGCCLAGNDTAAARLVVYNKRLLEQSPPTLGHGATHHVTAPTGHHGHDVANGFVGVCGLCVSQGGQQAKGRCGL